MEAEQGKLQPVSMNKEWKRIDLAQSYAQLTKLQPLISGNTTLFGETEEFD